MRRGLLRDAWNFGSAPGVWLMRLVLQAFVRCVYAIVSLSRDAWNFGFRSGRLAGGIVPPGIRAVRLRLGDTASAQNAGMAPPH